MAEERNAEQENGQERPARPVTAAARRERRGAARPAARKDAATDTETKQAPKGKTTDKDRPARKAKAEPGKISFASSGVGTTSHLAGMQFAEMAGIDVLHVPYKGTSQSLQDLITGRVGYTIDNLGPILPFIQSKQLIAIGVSTTQPVSLLPGVPPISSVLPGYSLSSWNVLAVPAGTPKDVIAILSKASDKVLHTQEVMDRARSFGSETVGGTPDSVARFLKEERVRWEAAVNSAKLDKNTFR